MRRVPGDPLTGSLPRTKLVVPQQVHGPTRVRRPGPSRDSWPVVPDSLAITLDHLVPGRIASIRTRWGVRQVLIRTINRSREGRNRGRHFITGMTTRGLCRSYWVDRIISVETVQRALAMRRAIEANIKKGTD